MVIKTSQDILTHPTLEPLKFVDRAMYLYYHHGERALHTAVPPLLHYLRWLLKRARFPCISHQWGLLHHLPALRKLTIKGCSHLITSPEIIHRPQPHLPRKKVAELTSLQELTLCECAIMTLLERLGELTSVKCFVIEQCEGSGPRWTASKNWPSLNISIHSLLPYTLEKWFESSVCAC